MRYSRLQWNHSHPAEPVEVLSEYDEAGWEIRKVERFPDGAFGYASAAESAGGTQLSLIQRPPDAEVAAEPEFRVSELSKVDFERIWAAARQPLKKMKRVS
ncbi:MAG: hypothetical protein HYX68_02750 [Planctomycetes bacterium]|nr:hypothetical protein [Planctomycetota bacterium]